MDILKTLEIMKQSRIDNASNLTIGELLKKIEKYEDGTPFKFTCDRFLDDEFDSYRGYYDDMYLGYSDKDEGYNTIGHLKRILEEALKQGTMVGYKGGDFSIDGGTLLWLSSYGMSSDGLMLVEVVEINGEVYIVTKEDSFYS